MNDYPSDIVTYESLIQGPTIEPLDLEEMKKQQRFKPTTLDTLFDTWIAAARQHFETQTGRQIMTATWEFGLEAAPSVGVIELPHPPLQDVLSITYDDDNGDEQTFTDYSVVAPAGPLAERGRVCLNSGASWPTFTSKHNGLRIRYRAGYGDARADVPEMVKAALMYVVGHFHKYGEEVQETTNALQRLPLGFEIITRDLKWSALPKLPRPKRYDWSVTGWPA